MGLISRKLTANRISPIVVIVTIAVTSAMVGNLLFIVSGLSSKASVSTGVADERVWWARLGPGLSATPFSQDAQANDVQALAKIDEIESITTVSSLPFTGTGKYVFKVSGAAIDQMDPVMPATAYLWSNGATRLLGIKLIAGRDFVPEEYVQYSLFSPDPVPPQALITRSLAERLWPRTNALGKHIQVSWMSESVTTVVGVVEELRAPTLSGDTSDTDAIIFPVNYVSSPIYVIRARQQKGPLDIRNAITDVLYANDPRRIITDVQSMAITRKLYFRGDTVMMWMLVVLAGVMSGMAAVGLVAVLTHWLSSRNREIGIRRALGARKIDIVKQLMGESFRLGLCGGAIGAVLCAGMNLLLMRIYEIERISNMWLLVVGAVAIGLAALTAAAPAISASRRDPALLAKT